MFSHYLSFELQTTNFLLRLEGGAIPLTMNVFCRFCRNDIGDSFHYLLVCKHFENKRKLLIDKYYYTRPNVSKYKQLLCQENVAVLKKTVFVCLTYNENCLLIKTLLQ